MVQILPPKKPGIAQQLLSGAAEAAPEALAALTTQMERDNIINRRKNYYKELGLSEDLAFAPESVQKTEVEKRIRGPSVWDKFNQGNVPTEQPAMGGQPKGDQPEQRLSKYDIWKMMSPEEKAQVATESPQMAKAFRERDKQLEEKKPPLREQPIEKDQLEAIQNVRQQSGFEDMSAKDQYRAFIDAGVSPVNAEREAKFRGEEEKLSLEEKREFHKESKDYHNRIAKEARQAHNKLRSIDRQREIAPTLTTQDRVISAIFGGTKLENLLKSKNAQEFDALVLPQIEGMRDLFGVRLSDADLRLVLQKIATSDKNPEANLAILDFYELEPRLALERDKIAKEILKESRGYRPPNFEILVEDRLNERLGDEIQQKYDAVMGLKDDSSRKQQITERRDVTPGTKLDEKTKNFYYKKAGGDPELAWKMAQEDGYGG